MPRLDAEEISVNAPTDPSENRPQGAETRLSGPLDELLKDLHLVWCDDECPTDWHRAGADAALAAIKLATALWDMADDAADGAPSAATALATLTTYVENV